eukprot:17464_1
MADSSKLDSQFILETNKSQHKATKDQIIANLHRSVRSNKSKHAHLETTCPPHDLRNQLRTLYQSMYEEDSQFEERASKLLHASIQKMQSKKSKKKSTHNHPSHKAIKPHPQPHPHPHPNPHPQSASTSKPTSTSASTEFAKPKRRPRKKIKQEERFTQSWNQSILRKKIKVYWPLDKKFYRGIVSAINESKQKPVLVEYGDGDKEWLNLKNENFLFYEISSSDSSSDNNDNRSGEFMDTDDEDDMDTDYAIGDRPSMTLHKQEDDLDDEEDGDILRKKSRKIRKKSKKKSQKKKKKRKKKKKNKSLSKSPKSDKKKKRKREMDDKEDTTDTVQQTLRNNPMPMPMPMNVVQPAVPNAMNLVQMTHKPPSNTQHIMVERMNHEQVIHAPMIRPIKEAQQVTVHVKHEKPTDSNSESDKSSTDTQRDAMSEDSNELNKNNIESEESDEDSDLIEEEEEIQENESNDPWIDCHVTITIDGDRFDGIVEKRKQKEGDENVMYKIKFDTSNWRESEWVRADQMQIQQITTCENFKIGDVVVVREHGEWMEDAIANVRQVYQGATGVIVQAVFPEFDGVFMYCRLRDVKKTGNVSH